MYDKEDKDWEDTWLISSTFGIAFDNNTMQSGIAMKDYRNQLFFCQMKLETKQISPAQPFEQNMVTFCAKFDAA